MAGSHEGPRLVQRPASAGSELRHRPYFHQVGEGRWDAVRVLDIGSCNNALAKELRDMTLGCRSRLC